jgi:hypothetical protein
MSVEIIVSVIIALLVLLIIFTLKGTSQASRIQSKDEKKAEIFNLYKDKLIKELDFIDDKEIRVQRKKELLKEFSSELSRNIFLDANDVRGMIMELSKV